MKKRFLLSLFIISILIFLSSCSFIRINEKPRHTCSFDTETVVSRQDCAFDGIIVRSCVCGQQRTEITPAPGHSFGEWMISKEAGCTTLGYENRICSVCDKTETRIIEDTGHSYIMSEEQQGDILYNKYTCEKCDDSFLLQAGVVTPEAGGDSLFLTDREVDFAFIIISSEDEEYIREHLKIVNAFFESSLDSSEYEIDYTLTSLGGGRFSVSAIEDYEGGATYVAMRSGAVIFSDSGFDNLVFSVKAEEKNSLSFADDVIFIAALEKEKGGYYPYNIDYSDWSGDYFLTLESADGLAVGDLICVGDATSFDELIANNGRNTFGRISAITLLNDGRTLLMLNQPSLSELFGDLQIYTDSISIFEKISNPDDPEDQLTLALYSDPQFQNLVSLAYSEATGYLNSRGLSTKYTDFSEFISSIVIDSDESFEPILIPSPDRSYVTAKIAIKGEGRIPVMSEESEIGEISIEFSAFVTINSLSMKMWMEDARYGDSLDLTFEMSQDTSFGFSFDIGLYLDYSSDHKLFAQSKSDNLYHYIGCRELPSNYTELSIAEMLTLLSSGEGSQCPICHPISNMKQDIFVIDEKSSEYHTTSCKLAGRISAGDLSFSERIGKSLEEDGYTPCSSCHPDKREATSFEEALVDRINRADYGEYREEFDALLGGLERRSAEISLGEYMVSLSGLDSEKISLTLYFDFHISAALHYEYEANQSFVIGFRNTESGIKHYESMSQSKLVNNEIAAIGSFEIYLGERTVADVSIKGFDYLIHGSFDAKCGIYSNLRGQLIISDEDSVYDSASSHESGISLSAGGNFYLPESKIDYTEFISHTLPLCNTNTEIDE